MCGFIVTSDPEISPRKFRESLELINHRGPDATGILQTAGVQFGHKRLKIIDLDDRSNQPFTSHDGRYHIVFNGEIYNHDKLAKKYALERRTNSDTEVLVELYARLGPSFLTELNGMFTLCIFDTQTLRLFVARDRLGVKPLYISEGPRGLTLASEIAPVLALTGLGAFDLAGLRQYLKLRTFFNGRTPYRGISMFPAGHYMLDGNLHRYWSLPEDLQQPPTDEELRYLIEESVSERLMSDVPLGSYLSGGLDSTIVAALAAKPDTWTVGFRDCNEFAWGRIAAERFGSRHHEILVEPMEFVDMARTMIRSRREPLSVPNEVLLYKMTMAVKEKNTVVLSGEGADELFFGYDRIFRWAASTKALSLEEFAKLYSYGSHEDIEIVEDALGPFMHRRSVLDTVAHFFQVAHLHGLLRRLDNSTMLCSVEARVPFVDCHTLVERMAGVPFEYRMAGGEVKAPLKRIFADLLPEGIIHRKKIGFPVPLHEIPFPSAPDNSPMDRWLRFNLSELCGADLDLEELMKGQ